MKFHYKVTLLLLALFALTSCGKMKKDDARWVTLQDEVRTDLREARTVLVEEFTGQDCPNCPLAAKLLHGLTTSYPHNVVTVALHAKHTGQTKPELESDAAQHYAQQHQIPRTIPGVLINRLPQEEGKLYSTHRDSWTAKITQLLQQKPPSA